MMFSDATIKKLLASGQISVLPSFDMKDIRPAGIRLHLGSKLLIPKKDQTTELSGGEVSYDEVEFSRGYTLRPDEFVLGTTYERFQVPRSVVCHIDGRSTVARLGLSIHCTSAVIDGNYDEPRSVVLEIKNIGPMNIILKPSDAVAMLTFTQLSEPIEQASQVQYRG